MSRDEERIRKFAASAKKSEGNLWNIRVENVNWGAHEYSCLQKSNDGEDGLKISSASYISTHGKFNIEKESVGRM